MAFFVVEDTTMNWIRHFEKRPPLKLDVFNGEHISKVEHGRIAYSIAQFQRGESSEAADYLEKSRRFAFETDHPTFFWESRLFVIEENFHSKLLGAFMAQMGIGRAGGSWTDVVFRWLRSLGDIGWSSRVLLTAELLAQVYYPALKEATKSGMLAAICERIIEDEEYHILFQTERIAFVLQNRSRLSRTVQSLAGLGLFVGTAVVVWFEHRPVLSHSLSFWEYVRAGFGRYTFAMSQLNAGLDNDRLLALS